MKRTLTLLALSLITGYTSANELTIATNGKITYHLDGTVVSSYGTGYGQYCSVNQIQSTRFYDSNKGGPWTRPYSDGTEGDSLMCWSHAASNSLQYWQDVYGVFYRDRGEMAATGNATPRELPNGFYSTTTASGYDASGIYQQDAIVNNARELNIAQSFYNNWNNGSGKFGPAVDWYFKWDSTTNPSGPGGYYSEYFGNGSDARASVITIYSDHAENTNSPDTQGTTPGYSPFADTAEGLKNVLLPAFGFSTDGDNTTYTQTEEGLMPFLGIWEKNKGTGHMVSCQGFTTDANGKLISLLVADGDDDTARLQEVYVAEEDGLLMLYKDKDATKPFYTESEYYVGEVSYINTPEVLRNMLSEYRSQDEAAVWNGHATVWKTQTDVADSEIATASTGWDIHVNGSDIDEKHHDYYHGYATEGRNILFDTHAAEGQRTVTIEGTVSAANIEIAAAGYEFRAGQDAVLKAGANLTIQSLASLSSAVSLNLGDLVMSGGASLSSTSPITVTGTFSTLQPEQAQTEASTDATPVVTINADLDLSQATAINLSGGVELNQHGLILNKGTAITFDFTSGMDAFSLFSGISSLTIDGTTIAHGTDLSDYLNITSANQRQSYHFIFTGAEISLLVPEPTTSTLSILALAALAARRKR